MKVKITKLHFDGWGIGIGNEKKVYVPNVFIGEEVEIKKIKRKKKKLIAHDYTFLKTIGVDSFQGFLLSKPISQDELIKTLSI